MQRFAQKPRRHGLSPWHLLLLIPYPAVLWVPFYNTTDPVVFGYHLMPVILGFPFFYAYQMIWVFITAALTAFVYWVTR